MFGTSGRWLLPSVLEAELVWGRALDGAVAVVFSLWSLLVDSDPPKSNPKKDMQVCVSKNETNRYVVNKSVGKRT